MFSNYSQNQQSHKSQFHKKRQQFQKSKAHQQRQKIIRTLRFQTLLDDIFQKKIVQNYQSTLNNSVEQIQKQLIALMNSNDFLKIALLIIIQIKTSNRLEQILDQQILQNLINYSNNKMSRPEIVLIFRSLAQVHMSFHQAVLNQPQILNQIIKQIKNLKNNRYQQIYFDILQYIINKRSQKYQNLMLECFDKFCDLINDSTINIKSGIRILKVISPYIKQFKQIQNSLLQKIIQCYQNQTTLQLQNDYSTTMVNCFIVLIKVILYQSNVDLILNLKIMRILSHSKMYFPSKIINDYIKYYKLVYLIIKKTGQYQQQLNKQQSTKYKEQLIKKNNNISQQILKKAYYPLTTLMCDYFLRQNQFLLQQKLFQVQYLGFILTLVQHMDKYIILKYFYDKNFFQFLIQCLDHINNQIIFLSLSSIYSIISQQNHSTQLYAILKIRFNLIEILENTLYTSNNKQIIDKCNNILENIQLYAPEN